MFIAPHKRAFAVAVVCAVLNLGYWWAGGQAARLHFMADGLEWIGSFVPHLIFYAPRLQAEFGAEATASYMRLTAFCVLSPLLLCALFGIIRARAKQEIAIVDKELTTATLSHLAQYRNFLFFIGLVMAFCLLWPSGFHEVTLFRSLVSPVGTSILASGFLALSIDITIALRAVSNRQALDGQNKR